MASEQATAAAGELVTLIQDKPFDYPMSSDIPEIAAIIDAAFAPVVAELVALLLMGKELAEASRDSTQGTPQKRYRAAKEANAILDRYDEAIARHRGGQ